MIDWHIIKPRIWRQSSLSFSSGASFNNQYSTANNYNIISVLQQIELRANNFSNHDIIIDSNSAVQIVFESNIEVLQVPSSMLSAHPSYK